MPDLLANGLAAPVHLPPLTPSYPKSYDPNVRCNYHAGAQGHSIENCTALKYKVRDLFRAGALKFEFEKQDGPNVASNPLPNHGGGGVNAIGEETSCQVEGDLGKVKMLMTQVWEILLEAGIMWPIQLKLKKGQEVFCDFHGSHGGHDIQECLESRFNS